ncbi:afadin-like isoform X1 [Leptotrombidium deliense]|uniref:Afadin-like isoform X1 n=1 Tax=Leptotrombidium deliense TaxID=299467 RepID=A0A443SN68_9ACAR|nr:afadin-like isoform X1 [Leptotrombidium deliense]
MSADKQSLERQQLSYIIRQWNDNRLDLFALSEPNDDLEFHGVMRFYFQDAGQKVATKCIRVSSTASSQDVIQTLIEKFHPDFRMLSVPEYGLYEIHESGEERKLSEEEKPLLVQLNWHKDDREGRFLLRRMDEKTYFPGLEGNNPEGNHFNRRLSKKKKKEKKKRERKDSKEINDKDKDGIASRLYNEIPETSFTRSISNPEAVMRRRRQQKLEKKLQQLCQEGGPDAGGTLRIFGESLNKDVPYKTLLLSTKDTAGVIVKEILNKYGKDREDSNQFCLVQLIVPHEIGDNSMNDTHIATAGIRQYILDDDDCPLFIEKQHNKARGTLTFHIKRRPADYQPRKRKKKPEMIKGELDAGYNTKYDEVMEKLSYLDVNSKIDGETQSSIAESVSGDNHVPSVEPLTIPEMHKFYEALQGVEITVIKLPKSNNCMGLSIVAAKGPNQDKMGIYIKSVVQGGAADLDGRLQAGDLLLKVDGHSLLGISQERAAELITQTGSVVTLEVAKQAAIHFGLGVLIHQQSPSVHRGMCLQVITRVKMKIKVLSLPNQSIIRLANLY